MNEIYFSKEFSARILLLNDQLEVILGAIIIGEVKE